MEFGQNSQGHVLKKKNVLTEIPPLPRRYPPCHEEEIAGTEIPTNFIPRPLFNYSVTNLGDVADLQLFTLNTHQYQLREGLTSPNLF